MTPTDTRTARTLKEIRDDRLKGQPRLSWTTPSDSQRPLSLREDYPDIIILDIDLGATLGSFNWARNLVRVVKAADFGLPGACYDCDVQRSTDDVLWFDPIDDRERWILNPLILSEGAIEFPPYEPGNATQLALTALEREFVLARDEIFEDGMGSRFSRAFDLIIEKYGRAALTSLDEMLSRADANSEVGSEALIQLGFPKAGLEVGDQVELLCKFLQSHNVRFRDAASLGLARLDDPSALPAVLKAIDKEQSALLRASLQEVAYQLDSK